MKKFVLSITSLILLSSCNIKTQTNITPVATTTDEQNITIQSREIVSRVLGDAPNFAQTANGNLSAVVSRDFGRGAKAGALIEFFYPLYTKDHLWDSYNGIYYKNQLSWFHDLELVKQSVTDDTGIIVSEFKTKDKKLTLKTEDVALQDNDTLVRHLEIVNNSSENIENLKTFFYEFLNVNYIGAGDDLVYDEKTGTLLHSDGKVFFTIGSSITPEQWQCGGANNPITKALDARKDAEDGVLKKNLKAKGLIGFGVNGNLGHTINLKPKESFSINYFISAGQSQSESFQNFNNSKQRTWETIEKSDLSYWTNFLSRAKKPTNMPKKVERVYRRALITIKQDTANNGAVIAAPTLLSPVYGFTWPRDGSVTASAYLEAGYPEQTKKFIEFISSVQKPNGGWAVNFFMDGSKHLWDFGDKKNEHDQVGTVIWITNEYYKKTNDIEFLKTKWDMVKKAADFLLKYNSDKNLMTECRDLWELHTDKSWAFTNAAAYSGLKNAAEIAEALGDETLKNKYSSVAEKMKQAIYDKLWYEEGEYYVRGLNLYNNKFDTKVEAANLGLSYPFEVFPYTDPRMKKMADKIYKDLASYGKGIKRYTDDKYYDGNPWPATTDWLAIYYAKSGNKSRALELHNAVTNYAYQTNSLMLGEQFDEQKKLWVSAFPLTWSESKYVLGTIDIYSN